MVDNYQRTALMLACGCNRPDCVLLLVENEAGMRNVWGQTALHIAVEWGHAECVQLLLGREAEIEDKNGRTPLEMAKKNGSCEDLIKTYFKKIDALLENVRRVI